MQKSAKFSEKKEMHRLPAISEDINFNIWRGQHALDPPSKYNFKDKRTIIPFHNCVS